MTTESLERYLVKFDGKAVSPLSEARVTCGTSPDYLEDLVTLCADPRTVISDGATWMLKAELDEGLDLPADLTRHLVQSLDAIQSWQAMLHLCQSVDRLRLTPSQVDRFMGWAQGFADHPRPFLRAWSLHARVVLGRGNEKYQQDVERTLRAADDDKAASVRARARQLRKAMTPGTGRTPC